MQIFIKNLYNIKLSVRLEPDVWEAVFWLYDKYNVYFPLPKLMKKLSVMDNDAMFPRLFNIFQKIPRLRQYFVEHTNEFIMAILKMEPKNRNKAMQDYLMTAKYC